MGPAGIVIPSKEVLCVANKTIWRGLGHGHGMDNTHTRAGNFIGWEEHNLAEM
jgi:hypothetical protein